jgi:hypothetical protein
MPSLLHRYTGLVVAVLATVTATVSGCGTRTFRETFYEDAQTRIVLRQQKKSREVVERDYHHPFAIAPVRLAHILSRIDVRTESKKGDQRSPAFATEALYVVADHLSKAFGQADSTQEIVVYFIRRDKRWGVFDRRYLTSFVTYAAEDVLYIHLSRVEWEIEKTGKQERLPEPRVGDFVMKFRVIPSKGMSLLDGQSVAVDWRSSVFQKPTRTRISPSGKVVRRTILMESPEEEEGGAGDESAFERLPENLSSSTLRQLADLEDERHRGEITEADYNARRRQIIRSDPASR